MRHNLTLPNAISLCRLLLAWPLGYTIYHGYFYTVLVLGFIVILSDFLDGYFSRRLNQHSPFGKALDPIADFVVVLLVIVSLYLTHKLPLWYLQLILIRYLIIFITLVFYRLRTGINPSSIPSGKYAMALLSLTLLTAWLELTIHPLCLTLSVILLLISLLDYLYTFGYKR